MISDIANEFRRYRMVADKAVSQVPDDELNRVVAPDGNSVAMLIRHLSGNLVSRFTDFLETDGEKPWRDRDSEFEERPYTRAEVEERWETGWRVLDAQLAALTESDISRTVRIRGQALTVQEALLRSMAHVAYHVGQIVLIARMLSQDRWRWITIPKGESTAYNSNPTMERRPS
jgi:hypothetical protein